jgi:hypothetical protein
LEVAQELQSFYWAEFVYVHLSDSVGYIVVDGFEQADLDGGILGNVVFVMRQDLACTFNYGHGEGGKARHFDTVAFVGGSGFYFAEKKNLVF